MKENDSDGDYDLEEEDEEDDGTGDSAYEALVDDDKIPSSVGLDEITSALESTAIAEK